MPLSKRIIRARKRTHTARGKAVEINQEHFLRDVKDHKMVIERDDGNGNRQVYFGEPGTMMQHFRIVTFLDYLLFTGDMGTFVFRRQKDMFTFFRGDGINLGYWSEKIEASDHDSGTNGVMVYDQDKAVDYVVDHVYPEHEREEQDTEAVTAFREEVQYSSDDEIEFISYCRDCDHLDYSDFWPDFSDRCYKSYSRRYIWACYAIQWAIDVYDGHCKRKSELQHHAV